LTTMGKKFTRHIPLHSELREALAQWQEAAPARAEQIVQLKPTAG
jgi:hypothetical protein